KIGSYMNPVWQDANNPVLVESQTIRLKPKLVPGQNEVVLYLLARELAGREGTPVVWRRPRFEGGKQAPLLLRDLADFGDRFETHYRAVYADTAKYLSAAAELAHDPKLSSEALSKKHGVDAALFRRWVGFLGIASSEVATRDPPVPLQPLGKKQTDVA